MTNNNGYTVNRREIVSLWTETERTSWEVCDALVPFVGQYEKALVLDLLAHLNKAGVRLRSVNSVYDRARAGRTWQQVKRVPELAYLRNRLPWTHFAEVGSVYESKKCDFEQMVEALVIADKDNMSARATHHLLKASARDQEYHEWEERLAFVRNQLHKIQSDYQVPGYVRGWARASGTFIKYLLEVAR